MTDGHKSPGAAPHPGSGRPSGPAPRIDYRVVVIDDDPDLRKLIQATLQYVAGWEVSTAADGPAGIDVVRDVRPDAVVIDVMMPEMDGYEVCRRLKSDPATAHIPLVFLTAHKHLDQAAARAAGICGVILKPFELDELAPQIRAMCSGGSA